MKIDALSQGLSDRLSALRSAGSRTGEGVDVGRLVDNLMTVPPGDMAAVDLRLFAEIQGLSDYIQRARQEIAELRPDDIRNTHLPAATDELDAVVGATESATNQILEAMESLEELTDGMAPETAEKVTEVVTSVFEACNFQDITGQRITKVVTALQEIETRVVKLMTALGDETVVTAQAQRAVHDGREDADLLNGPQLPGEAVNQADIDALFDT